MPILAKGKQGVPDTTDLLPSTPTDTWALPLRSHLSSHSGYLSISLENPSAVLAHHHPPISGSLSVELTHTEVASAAYTCPISLQGSSHLLAAWHYLTCSLAAHSSSGFLSPCSSVRPSRRASHSLRTQAVLALLPTSRATAGCSSPGSQQAISLTPWAVLSLSPLWMATLRSGHFLGAVLLEQLAHTLPLTFQHIPQLSQGNSMQVTVSLLPAAVPAVSPRSELPELSM